MNTESQTPRPLLIGLTGGIASGKSVVSQMLSELGAIIVDADKIARDAVAKGSNGLAQVVAAFGTEILTEDGNLNRPALGARIFADEKLRETLNEIVHPIVRAESARLVDSAPQDAVVVQDIPLLVETGQAGSFDLVLVVQAPKAERVRRMVEDRKLTREEAESRITAQATDEQRAAVADLVIDNSGTLDELRHQVKGFWENRVLPAQVQLIQGGGQE